MAGNVPTHNTVDVHEKMNPAMAQEETKAMDAAEIERVKTPDDDLQKDKQDYGRIDVHLPPHHDQNQQANMID